MTAKAQNPKLEEAQRKGRSLLWDRDLDLEALREFEAAQVPQPPYVYQTKPSQR